MLVVSAAGPDVTDFRPVLVLFAIARYVSLSLTKLSVSPCFDEKVLMATLAWSLLRIATQVEPVRPFPTWYFILSSGAVVSDGRAL